jgi:hypothetical protein
MEDPVMGAGSVVPRPLEQMVWFTRPASGEDDALDIARRFARRALEIQGDAYVTIYATRERWEVAAVVLKSALAAAAESDIEQALRRDC